MRAAAAEGIFDRPPDALARLDSFDLEGTASPVDSRSLSRLAGELGPGRLALVVQTVLECPCLAVDSLVSAEHLIAGLLDCIPPECRSAITFTTGLKHCSRRPFRIVPFPRDEAARCWLAHQPHVSVLDLCRLAAAGPPLIDGWARLIRRILASDRVAFLATQLSKPRPGCALEDLGALGLQLLEELDVSPLDGLIGLPPRAHAAHHRFEKSGPAATATAATATLSRPSQHLDPDSPEVLAKLEMLDDMVFDAINGRSVAIDRLRKLWVGMQKELGLDLFAESREQYLRYALSVWEQGIEREDASDPANALLALEVLCVLFDET
jgi:hypothetical protein